MKLIVKLIKNKNSAYIIYSYALIVSISVTFVINQIGGNQIILILCGLVMYTTIELFSRIAKILNIRISFYFGSSQRGVKESLFAVFAVIPFLGQGILAWRSIVLLEEIRNYVSKNHLTIEEIEQGIYLNSPQNIERRKREGLLVE